MKIGVMKVRLHVPMAQSLKDKRQVIRSLKDRLLSRFYVSVAEVADQDLHQMATIGICFVALETKNADVAEGLQDREHLISFIAELCCRRMEYAENEGLVDVDLDPRTPRVDDVRGKRPVELAGEITGGATHPEDGLGTLNGLPSSLGRS